MLHSLLQKVTKRDWTENPRKKVEQLKTTLSSSDTLVRYEPKLPLVLYADASEEGLGWGYHCFQDRVANPIAYSSCSLNKVEKRYSVTDREGLAIVNAVRIFERYMYGRKFILRTDHKPLKYIFGERSNLPEIVMSCYAFRVRF